MSTHTPGPWSIDRGTFEQIHVHGYEDVTIAVVSKQDPQCDGGRSVETERANARLIAAAPQLLQVLEDLIENNQLVGYHQEQARAAIAAATKAP